MPRKYRVSLSPAAERDVSSTHAHIARDAPLLARRWTSGLRRQVRSLNAMPERFEVIPEVADVGFEYRHLFYAGHRVIYRIDPGHVRVVRVIRASRLLERSMLAES